MLIRKSLQINLHKAPVELALKKQKEYAYEKGLKLKNTTF